MFQIPFYRFDDAGVECFVGAPAQFRFQFGGVNRVSEIVAGTVGNKCDLFGIFVAVCAWVQVVQDIANRVHNRDIIAFVVSTDVICFAGFAVVTFIPNV